MKTVLHKYIKLTISVAKLRLEKKMKKFQCTDTMITDLINSKIIQILPHFHLCPFWILKTKINFLKTAFNISVNLHIS